MPRVVLSALLVGAHAFVPPGQRPAPASRLRSPEMDFSGIFNGEALKGTYERLTDWRVARASHILLKGQDAPTVERMRAMKQEIGGDAAKFAEVARESSQCPSRVKGGDLGFFTRGKMVKEFDSVVFSERPGAVYGPVRTDFGHHLIFLHSCRQPDSKFPVTVPEASLKGGWGDPAGR